MVKSVLKIVVSIKSYRQKTDFLPFFFGLGPMVHMGITKTPIFLKIRLLDQWALSRILVKIDKNKINNQIKKLKDFCDIIKSSTEKGIFTSL